jgi:hypothetical protein
MAEEMKTTLINRHGTISPNLYLGSKIPVDDPPDILYIGEMAYRSYSEDETTNLAIDNLLFFGGEVILQSAPNFTKGLFYELWCESDAMRLQLPYWLHPDNNHLWAKKRKAELGNSAFGKEYMCQFVDENLRRW